MSEIRFSDGIPERKERYNDGEVFIYPEEIIGKKCGGCVRCEKRDRKEEKGYHCTMRSYSIDIDPENKACVDYWDREENKRIEQQRAEDTENRRKELWAIYAEREPIRLPIVNDGYGMIPECPICGEMPYSTEQCHWCGQRFIQDEEIEEYNKPITYPERCATCGNMGEIYRSRYNGHRSFYCKSCGTAWIE